MVEGIFIVGAPVVAGFFVGAPLEGFVVGTLVVGMLVVGFLVGEPLEGFGVGTLIMGLFTVGFAVLGFGAANTRGSVMQIDTMAVIELINFIVALTPDAFVVNIENL